LRLKGTCGFPQVPFYLPGGKGNPAFLGIEYLVGMKRQICVYCAFQYKELLNTIMAFRSMGVFLYRCGGKGMTIGRNVI
jgi:hypothetical protein